MNPTLEQQIRERAYYLWLLGGCLHERADEHWLSAERELIALSATPAKPKKQVTAKKVGASEPSEPPRAASKRKVVAAIEVAAQR